MFGSIAPPDNFEQRLAAFAAARGIDVSTAVGRQFALELAARGNPEVAETKRSAGRPSKVINRLFQSDDTDILELLETVAAGRCLSDRKVLIEFISEKERQAGRKPDPNSSLFLAELRRMQNKVSAARRRVGKPKHQKKSD
ncbi:MAG: hypothetical protein KL840_21760 [Aquamicrobium sp.]|nr:hypothetical protein [Aquamicrobium sp.]